MASIDVSNTKYFMTHFGGASKLKQYFERNNLAALYAPLFTGSVTALLCSLLLSVFVTEVASADLFLVQTGKQYGWGKRFNIVDHPVGHLFAKCVIIQAMKEAAAITSSRIPPRAYDSYLS